MIRATCGFNREQNSFVRSRCRCLLSSNEDEDNSGRYQDFDKEVRKEVMAALLERLDAAGRIVAPGFIDLQINGAGGVLFNDKEEILACKRGANQVMGGHWEFPGGKIDVGETTTAALQRELLEELGIEAQVGSLIDKVVHDYPSMIVNIEFYKCATDAKVFSQVVHDDFQWVDEKSALSLNWLPADIDFVQQLVERGFSSI